MTEQRASRRYVVKSFVTRFMREWREEWRRSRIEERRFRSECNKLQATRRENKR